MLDEFLNRIERSRFFDRSVPVFIARAPGRLDVMGGIADYSGSLVLQRPTREATFTAIQRTNDTTIEVISTGSPQRQFTFNVSDIQTSYEEARFRFNRSEENRWISYIAGVLVVLVHECGMRSPSGARVFISSDVPESKGVASSAALEVAVMNAACRAFDVQIPRSQMAILCQKAENVVAGAPCGVMDQMTSMCGESDSLLALLCQPAELQEPVHVPDGIQFWGIDSGERHTVSGSDYSSVRTGAFMGHRIISTTAGDRGGYLANISVEEFEREFDSVLPEEMSGAAFIARYSGTADTVTTVDSGRVYKIRKPTAHPVYEHCRVQEFRRLLRSSVDDIVCRRLGELMLQSHESYSACGLGSPGTTIIVDLVRSAGPAKGLYGARITGGGSGGTVAVMGRADAENAIMEIARAYETRTAHLPYVFAGSSPGAARFGVVRAQL